MERRSRIMSTSLLALSLVAVSEQVVAAQPPSPSLVPHSEQAAARHPAFPSTFKSQIVHSPAGADIFVRSAGTGPVVVLIHGYAETSDSWAPPAAELEKP